MTSFAPAVVREFILKEEKSLRAHREIISTAPFIHIKIRDSTTPIEFQRRKHRPTTATKSFFGNYNGVMYHPPASAPGGRIPKPPTRARSIGRRSVSSDVQESESNGNGRSSVAGSRWSTRTGGSGGRARSRGGVKSATSTWSDLSHSVADIRRLLVELNEPRTRKGHLKHSTMDGDDDKYDDHKSGEEEKGGAVDAGLLARHDHDDDEQNFKDDDHHAQRPWTAQSTPASVYGPGPHHRRRTISRPGAAEQHDQDAFHHSSQSNSTTMHTAKLNDKNLKHLWRPHSKGPAKISTRPTTATSTLPELLYTPPPRTPSVASSYKSARWTPTDPYRTAKKRHARQKTELTIYNEDKVRHDVMMKLAVSKHD